MKNLHVSQFIRVDISNQIVGFCTDADNGRLLVLTDGLMIYEVQENRFNEAKLVEHDLDLSLFPASIASTDIVTVEFIVESGSVLIILKRGQFLRIGVSSFSPQSAVIYEHNREISSIRLSPDQDLIALADTDNEIFILTSDFSLIHTSNALSQNDSVHKPVGVGWGSKETQFFGLDGRPSKEKSRDEKVLLGDDELSNLSKIESSDVFLRFRESQSCSTVIDWRGDGQYLATLTHIPENGKHYMKVWNRNLELQYMSEQLITMERGLLCWIPNGQYVCCAQRRDYRINEIAMFEKNGMIHQRVTLPTFRPYLYIKEFSWSPDSKILALVVLEFNLSSSSEVTYRHMIMLYTMQNFHYYLKYSSYLDCDAAHYLLRWNPIHHNVLYVSSTSGKCVEYNCNSTIDNCHDHSTVAVIDANKLLITPFKLCNIPPPMSAITIEFSGFISRLILNSKSIHQSFVLTADGDLYYDTSSMDANGPKVNCTISNKEVIQSSEILRRFTAVRLEPTHRLYQNLTAINNNLVIATCQVGNRCDILMLEISDSKVDTKVIETLHDKRVAAVVCGSYPNLILICDDLSCYQMNCITVTMFERENFVKPVDGRLRIKEAQYDEDRDILFTLTQDCTLYANQSTLASNCCTSFKISENFLIYTSTENFMNFIHLDKLDHDRSHHDICSWSQPIENGGVLVLVSEEESKVILQMPRGNLEILHPRILILLCLTSYLDNQNYLNAMYLARKYRVDLNFLCDYMLRCNEEQFFKDELNVFANTIASNDPSLLNLFIADLNNEDTTQSRYSSIMTCLPDRSGKKEKISIVVNSKVNKICSSIQLPSDNQYLQPKLLCLLKQDPPKTSEALILIHGLQDNSEKDAALKFLLYFVQIDKLFLDAISTYNTDIALMVASVSAKDPKDYLSLLDHFNTHQDINYRKYVMDMHIKNYERAFDNLLASLPDSGNKIGVIKQLTVMTVDKRIYKHAIKSCLERINEPCESIVEQVLDQLRVEIWTKYAEYLFSKRYYLEAGVAYLKSLSSDNHNEEKILDNVIKCFSFLGDCVRCLAVIQRIQPDTRKHGVLREKIRSQAISDGSVDAMLLSISRQDDFAAERLLHAREWCLAELTVPEESRKSFYERVRELIGFDVRDMITDLRDEIASKRNEFNRLKELLLKPQETDSHLVGDGYTAETLSTVDGSEATSVTMSGSGQLRARVARSGAPTLKTRVSSKSTKSQKTKGKKIQLKVGSRYEDMALVLELSKFIDKQKHKQDSARRLLAVKSEYSPLLEDPSDSIDTINALIRLRFNLASEIRETLWPKSDLDESGSVFSVYKRYGKLLATGDTTDNNEVRLLLRPELPPALVTFDL